MRPAPASGRFELRARPPALDRLIQEATERITRWSAPEAHSATAATGVIIDIRAQDARQRHGVIPGSLHIPRTVLEWRIALDSPWRSPHVGGSEQQMILICDHGYSSILAAANLVDLGFRRAGDIIGGFEAWGRLGLPVARYRPRPPTGGSRGPDLRSRTQGRFATAGCRFARPLLAWTTRNLRLHIPRVEEMGR